MLFSKAAESSLNASQLIEKAKAIEARIVDDLPTESDLHTIAAAVSGLAQRAERKPGKLSQLFSFTAIRWYVVGSGICWMFFWCFFNFVQNQDITVAVTGTETELILRKASQKPGIGSRIHIVESNGSAHSRDLLGLGEVDMGVIQAGIELDESMMILGIVRHEHILFFVHENHKTFPKAGEIPVVLTGAEGQGSHQLGKEFFRAWGSEDPKWEFGWSDFASEENPMELPEGVQAIFVVIDPVDARMQPGIKRAAKEGFVMHDSFIGAFESKHPYLHRVTHDRGFFRRAQPDVPDRDIGGYLVDNYLVASDSVSEQQILWARQAFELEGDQGRLMTDYLSSGRSTMIEDAANFTTIPINIVIIIAALFGVEILTERRYLHELNGLISRLSLLQADHDLYGWRTGETIGHNARYLDACSDLLSMISTVAAFYGEKRSAMAFDGMTNMLDSRANDLKINIGLKLIQGNAMLSVPEASPAKKVAKAMATKKKRASN